METNGWDESFSVSVSRAVMHIRSPTAGFLFSSPTTGALNTDEK